jgi:hypothetical protein
LLPHPKNWRTHPAHQRAALQGLLAEVGFADALLVRETPEGLMLIDGHLRAETTPEMKVPVLVLDVTEQEADKLLATLDPLAAQAGVAQDQLDALLQDVTTGSQAVADLLASLATAEPAVAPPGDFPTYDASLPTDHCCPKCGYAWSGKPR